MRHYERALAIREQLTIAFPEEASFRNDLAHDHDRVGGLHRAAGRREEAIRSYERHHDPGAARRQPPRGCDYCASLANTYRLLGVCQRETNRLELALDSYQKAQIRRRHWPPPTRPSTITATIWVIPSTVLPISNAQAEIRRRPAHASPGPGNPSGARRGQPSRRSLPECNGRQLQRDRDHPDRARPSERSVNDVQAISRSDASCARRRSGEHGCPRLALGAWHNTGNVLVRLGRPAEAVAAFRQAIDQKHHALAAGPKTPGRLRSLGNHYLDLAEAQCALGQPDDAAETLWEHRQLWENDPRGQYRLACGLAQCIPLLGRNRGGPSAVEFAASKRYGDRAMDALRKALAAGLRDNPPIQRHAQLAPLRARDDFQALASSLSFPSDPFRLETDPDILNQAAISGTLQLVRSAATEAT